jgi:hypothetical protein
MTAPRPHDQIDSVGGGSSGRRPGNSGPRQYTRSPIPRLPDTRPTLTVFVPVSRCAGKSHDATFGPLTRRFTGREPIARLPRHPSWPKSPSSIDDPRRLMPGGRVPACWLSAE